MGNEIPADGRHKRADPSGSFASDAIEGNRLAEICGETLRRVIAGEPVSDRYLLGLCWTLREMDKSFAPVITPAMLDAGARACSVWRGGKKYPFPTYDDVSEIQKQAYADQALGCLTVGYTQARKPELVTRILAIAALFGALLPPPSFSCPDMELAFSPNGGATELVVRPLNGTKDRMRVAAYSFTSKPIALALLMIKSAELT